MNKEKKIQKYEKIVAAAKRNYQKTREQVEDVLRDINLDNEEELALFEKLSDERDFYKYTYESYNAKLKKLKK